MKKKNRFNLVKNLKIREDVLAFCIEEFYLDEMSSTKNEHS